MSFPCAFNEPRDDSPRKCRYRFLCDHSEVLTQNKSIVEETIETPENSSFINSEIKIFSISYLNVPY